MADVQKQFVEFHGAIRLKPYVHNAVLREKRDAVLRKLKARLKALFEERGQAPPKYSAFDQGSYALGTGIRPTDDDFDIDVGLAFEVSKYEYPDPVVVKQWVYDALYGHTERVEMRRPCVTVFYQSENDPLYHVDLAVYSDAAANPGHVTYLAKGKQNSLPENRLWEDAHPSGLIEAFEGRFSGEDWDQFRRCVRYLKRWRHVKFASGGHAAPSGIAITVAAHHWFQVRKTCVDAFAGKYKYHDLEALAAFLQMLTGQFRSEYRDGELVDRLCVDLPVPPWNDLMRKMTDLQMGTFREQLEKLSAALEEARSEVDPTEACKTLQAEFGADFPVPQVLDTGQARGPAIISSSHAG